jgi:hypothetical protein
MTDQQVLTIAIAIVFPLAMLLYSNSRITDTRDTVRAELREVRAALHGEIEALRLETQGQNNALRAEMNTLRAEMDTLRAEMRAGFERLEMLLKMHELEHHK